MGSSALEMELSVSVHCISEQITLFLHLSITPGLVQEIYGTQQSKSTSDAFDAIRL